MNTKFNNINPKLWGDCYWKTLYFTAFSYPEQPDDNEKKNKYNYFYWVGKNLPCKSCQINYDNHLKLFPLDDYALSSRKNLINWLINIDNEVRKTTGKKLTNYNEIINYININKTNDQTYYYIFFTVIVVSILIILLIKVI